MPPEDGAPDWAPPTPGTATDADRSRLALPARQSPIALMFIAVRFTRRLGMSAVIAAVLFVSNDGLGLAIGVLAAAAATALLVFSALSWWRFTFMVDDDELVVTRGILSVERLVIPLDRVQSVAIEQRLVHRFVGLVSASVDTAGSSGVEFVIDAIDENRAEALRRVAADSRPVASGAEQPASGTQDLDEIVLRRTPAELVRVGVTKVPWAGLAAFAPLIALAGELDEQLDVGSRLERLVDRGGDVGGGSAIAVTALVVAMIVAATIVGTVLQLARELLTNWDLTLVRTRTGLRRTAGLVSTTSRSSTIRRIQSITTDESPPQRWLGFTLLRLRTFGENDISLPGTRPAEVAALRTMVFGHADEPDLDRSISRWFVFKATRGVAVVAVLLAVPSWVVFGWWSLLLLGAVAARWAAARRQWRLRRWSLDGDRVAEAYRFVARHTAEVPLHKAQVVTVSQSFFERRKGLATINVRTAAGFLAVPLIPYRDAAAVRDRILLAVETDHRRVI